jgi:6-pyruvoyltetrahydropterin/6-carboxytetrahydropterin synthase
VIVNFNPTAENMGQYLIEIVGPAQLVDTGVTLVNVNIEETRKCSVTVSK